MVQRLGPMVARAQQRLPTIGVLRIGPKEVEWFADQFRNDMKELGWEEGRNIRLVLLWLAAETRTCRCLLATLSRGGYRYPPDVREV